MDKQSIVLNVFPKVPFFIILTATTLLFILLFPASPALAATNEETMVTISTDELIKELNALAHYEIDKSFLLSQAADNLKNAEIKEKITTFKQDAENIIKELTSLIQNQGGKAPTHSKDFKGYFMQGYAAMRSLRGEDRDVLKALNTNIELTLNAYERTLKLHFDPKIRAEIESFYHKNKELQEYIVGKSRELQTTRNQDLYQCYYKN